MVKDLQDAVVVGGGPAGTTFACAFAKRGFSVTVFEEHSQIGLPSHCAGHLSIRSLRNLGLYPLPNGIVENTFSAANFYSPNGSVFSVRLAKPVTCAVNRAKFDAHLAEKAEASGTNLALDCRVRSLLLENGFVKGVKVAQDSLERKVGAKLVVDAEGISSRLLRQAGLQGLRGDRLVYAVEAEVEGVQGIEEHAVEVYFGKDYAPGFYGWLIPRLDGSAKVGLGVANGNPKDYFERLIRQHPVASKQLRHAKLKSMSFHAITLGGPIPKAYANGFLAIGDCASQVKPTTGGGVIFGVTCARIAAETAAEALKKADLTENALQQYQDKFWDVIGFDSGVMARARRALDTFSDKKLDRVLTFAAKVGLGESLRDIDEIDFQGRMMLSLVKRPSALATLTYLMGLYLSS